MGNVEICCRNNNETQNEESAEISAHIGKSRAGKHMDMITPTPSGKVMDYGEQGQEGMHTHVKAEIPDPVHIFESILENNAHETPSESVHVVAQVEISEKAKNVDQALLPFHETSLFKEYSRTHTDMGNATRAASFTNETHSEVYEGQWDSETNKYNGFGSLWQQNGGKISGFWNQGQLDGAARHTNAEGDYFEGHFKHGRYSGYGEFRTSNGNHFKGNWADGKMNGEGEEAFADGCFFRGNYVNGVKSGHGCYNWPDNSYYIGNLERNQQEGEGEYRWNDGREYKGSWSAGLMHGQGFYRFADGSYYQGQFVNNKKEGFGKLFWSPEKYFEGQWLDGKQEGEGKYFKNGTVTAGVWVNGKLSKKVQVNENEAVAVAN